MPETKKRLISENNLSRENEDDYYDDEYETNSKRKKRISEEKLSHRNNALKFTVYGQRKGIINTDIYLPTITQSQHYNTEVTDNNSFGSNKHKGGINFKKNLGRNTEEVYRFNKNPSSFDYRPKYDNMNKHAGNDDDYKKKKFKLMKMMKNYECKSDYQIVQF